jgi:hypothetical protein
LPDDNNRDLFTPTPDTSATTTAAAAAAAADHNTPLVAWNASSIASIDAVLGSSRFHSRFFYLSTF